jgi:hypothetical protein
MRSLAPPKNIRDTEHACCSNCKYAVDESGSPFTWQLDHCQRSPDCHPWGDPINIDTTVCDGFKRIVSRIKDENGVEGA